MKLNIKFYANPPISFCHKIAAPTQTDRHLVKTVKLSSGHPIACKSAYNRKLKVFTISMLPYIECRRKE